ncbi:MAG: nucleoside triphosphate pyrophosphohydrolase [Aestuariibacter sp.]
MSHKFPGVARLLWVMEQLRDPETGCPWDREQSFSTIVPFTIEEAYEVADAIETGDMAAIQDELGDLLFQVVFYAQLGKEQNHFDFETIAETVAEKLIRRHPHVFADTEISSEAELNAEWERIKSEERLAKGEVQDDSILAHIPTGMAPMKRAIKLQKRCAKVGFDWQDLTPVASKVNEEVDEILEALENSEKTQAHITEEVGDLLFAVLNLARHCQVDPDTALIRANQKFERRFRSIETAAKRQQQSLQDMSLDDMESLWQQTKKNEQEG